MFCGDGSYYEYSFDLDSNEVKGVAASNMDELKNTSD